MQQLGQKTIATNYVKASDDGNLVEKQHSDVKVSDQVECTGVEYSVADKKLSSINLKAKLNFIGISLEQCVVHIPNSSELSKVKVSDTGTHSCQNGPKLRSVTEGARNVLATDPNVFNGPRAFDAQDIELKGNSRITALKSEKLLLNHVNDVTHIEAIVQKVTNNMEVDANRTCNEDDSGNRYGELSTYSEETCPKSQLAPTPIPSVNTENSVSSPSLSPEPTMEESEATRASSKELNPHSASFVPVTVPPPPAKPQEATEWSGGSYSTYYGTHNMQAAMQSSYPSPANMPVRKHGGHLVPVLLYPQMVYPAVSHYPSAVPYGAHGPHPTAYGPSVLQPCMMMPYMPFVPPPPPCPPMPSISLSVHESEDEAGLASDMSKAGYGEDTDETNDMQQHKKECFFFTSLGWCKNGEKCPYRHPAPESNKNGPGLAYSGTQEDEEAESELETTANGGSQRRAQDCFFFTSLGWCKNGDKCSFKHPSPAVQQGPEEGMNSDHRAEGWQAMPSTFGEGSAGSAVYPQHQGSPGLPYPYPPAHNYPQYGGPYTHYPQAHMAAYQNQAWQAPGHMSWTPMPMPPASVPPPPPQASQGQPWQHPAHRFGYQAAHQPSPPLRAARAGPSSEAAQDEGWAAQSGAGGTWGSGDDAEQEHSEPEGGTLAAAGNDSVSSVNTCERANEEAYVSESLAPTNDDSAQIADSHQPVGPRYGECFFYWTHGWCKNGANCRYSHPDLPPQRFMFKSQEEGPEQLGTCHSSTERPVPGHKSDSADPQMGSKECGDEVSKKNDDVGTMYDKAARSISNADSICTSDVLQATSSLHPTHAQAQPGGAHIGVEAQRGGDGGFGDYSSGPIRRYSQLSSAHGSSRTRQLTPPLPNPTLGTVCNFFMSNGWCKYGPRCHYIHPVHANSPSLPQSSQPDHDLGRERYLMTKPPPPPSPPPVSQAPPTQVKELTSARRRSRTGSAGGRRESGSDALLSSVPCSVLRVSVPVTDQHKQEVMLCVADELLTPKSSPEQNKAWNGESAAQAEASPTKEVSAPQIQENLPEASYSAALLPTVVGVTPALYVTDEHKVLACISNAGGIKDFPRLGNDGVDIAVPALLFPEQINSWTDGTFVSHVHRGVTAQRAPRVTGVFPPPSRHMTDLPTVPRRMTDGQSAPRHVPSVRSADVTAVPSVSGGVDTFAASQFPKPEPVDDGLEALLNETAAALLTALSSESKEYSPNETLNGETSVSSGVTPIGAKAAEAADLVAPAPSPATPEIRAKITPGKSWAQIVKQPDSVTPAAPKPKETSVSDDKKKSKLTAGTHKDPTRRSTMDPSTAVAAALSPSTTPGLKSGPVAQVHPSTPTRNRSTAKSPTTQKASARVSTSSLDSIPAAGTSVATVTLAGAAVPVSPADTWQSSNSSQQYASVGVALSSLPAAVTPGTTLPSSLVPDGAPLQTDPWQPSSVVPHYAPVVMAPGSSSKPEEEEGEVKEISPVGWGATRSVPTVERLAAALGVLPNWLWS